jgi:transcriptional regulator with XRE-family HTH domain
VRDDPDWLPDRRREIGDRVRSHRLHAGLTQPDLGNAIGIDRRQIQRIERGETDARLSWLLLIADTLGLTLAELVEPRPPR